jgi:inner membrane protein
MENLTHTLFGLTMAKTGLERVTPLAVSTLVISSNFTDLDTITSLGGGTLASIKYHRGPTHSFVGILILSIILTAVLVYVDRRFRLRRDPFRRPIRPGRIFLLAMIGGLGHLFMDFTNSYGVRPMLPFRDQWVAADLVFVVDPWIWLILGSVCVWITSLTPSRTAPRTVVKLFWLAISVGTSLVMALALRKPSDDVEVTIPDSIRIIWFAGLALIVLGGFLKWGRAGAPLARWSLFVLAAYYGGMWIGHQTALERASRSAPVADAVQRAAWPTPGNPFLWQAELASQDWIYSRNIDLAPWATNRSGESEWRQMKALEPAFVKALRTSEEARIFLDFARFPSALVEQDGNRFKIAVRDARFNLRMYARLDKDLTVDSVELRWFTP